MGYSANSHIESIKDVETFFHHLIDERNVNFHPDDDFADYVCYADNTSSFTSDEVEIYNRLMDESFDVCKKAKVDIYEIGLPLLQKAVFGDTNQSYNN